MNRRLENHHHLQGSALVLVGWLTLVSACASGGDSACTRSVDCADGLQCINGTCGIPSDAAGLDAQVDSAVNPDVLPPTDTGPLPRDTGDLPRDTGADAGNDAGCVGPSCPGIPEHQWSRTLDGGDMVFDIVRDVVVDSTGSIIIIGKNSGTMTIDTETLATQGLGDHVIAKFSSGGVLDWARTFGSVEEDSGRSIAIDGSDNIYIGGHYQGPGVSFGGATLPHEVGDGASAFIASLNSSGGHRWSAGYSDPGKSAVNAIAVVGEHVYATGFFEQTLTTPIGRETSSGARDIFVLHMDRNGGHTWQERYGGSGEDLSLGSVANPSSSGLLVAGVFRDTANFGDRGSRSAMGTGDLFVLELSSTGAEVNVATFGHSGTEMLAHGITFDSNGSLVVGAAFIGSLRLAGTTEVSRLRDGLVLGLSPGLDYRWHHVISSEGDDTIRELAASDDGQVFAAGVIGGSFSLDGAAVPGPTGVTNGLTLAFDATGTSLWSMVWDSRAAGETWGLAVDGAHLYSCGIVRGNVTLGGPMLSGGFTGNGAMASYRIR